jgi:hypothetical protein
MAATPARSASDRLAASTGSSGVPEGPANAREQSGSWSRCIADADGQPGQNNQGPGAGQGGKGGTIVLNGEQPDGCASANGGKGGNGNRGSNAGRGGDGGTIKF